MDVATWNVNSLKVRLEQVVDWLGNNPVDVLCLQELKLTDELFPAAELARMGYRAWWRGQKGYNGVAIISRLDGAEMLGDLPGVAGEQRRFLAVTFGAVRVICVYVPNGEALDSDKYLFKREWLAALHRHVLVERQQFDQLVLTGDLNIAPAPLDVYNPSLWVGTPIHAPEMQEVFRQFTGERGGLIDCFRRFDATGGHYSWWDYRGGGYPRNLGLRIDHILASPALGERLTACHIDRVPRGWPRPSDHAPVVARFE